MKRFILILSVLLAASTLIACGNSTQQNDNTPSSDTKGVAVEPNTPKTGIDTDSNGNLLCPAGSLQEQDSSPEVLALERACEIAIAHYYSIDWKKIVTESNDGHSATFRIVGWAYSCAAKCPGEKQVRINLIYSDSARVWSSGGSSFGDIITESDESVANEKNTVATSQVTVATHDPVVGQDRGIIVAYNVNVPINESYQVELLVTVPWYPTPIIAENIVPGDTEFGALMGENGDTSEEASFVGHIGEKVHITQCRIVGSNTTSPWSPC